MTANSTPQPGRRSTKRWSARNRRHVRLRKKITGTLERPRLVVTRSARHIVAQVVDDDRGAVLAQASSYKLADGDKTARATVVGTQLAERATAAGVGRVVFDRGGNKYHGRIAALADAAREGGLVF